MARLATSKTVYEVGHFWVCVGGAQLNYYPPFAWKDCCAKAVQLPHGDVPSTLYLRRCDRCGDQRTEMRLCCAVVQEADK